MRADSLKENIENLMLHYNYRQPRKMDICFALFTLLPVNGSVYSFHKIWSAISSSSNWFFIYSFTAFSFRPTIYPLVQKILLPYFYFKFACLLNIISAIRNQSYKLYYTQIWWYTNQHMDMIWTCVCLNDLFALYLLFILCISLFFCILVQILCDIGVYIWNVQYFLFHFSCLKPPNFVFVMWLPNLHSKVIIKRFYILMYFISL